MLLLDFYIWWARIGVFLGTTAIGRRTAAGDRGLAFHNLGRWVFLNGLLNPLE